MKVGDTIWCFDVNRRVYDKPGMGGKIIYREHFAPHQIGSETKQSWLITDGYSVVKVNKKTMRQAANNGWGGWQWFSKQDMEDSIYVHDNKHQIVRQIQTISDAPLLRAVAAAIGYKEGEK